LFKAISVNSRPGVISFVRSLPFLFFEISPAQLFRTFSFVLVANICSHISQRRKNLDRHKGLPYKVGKPVLSAFDRGDEIRSFKVFICLFLI
jgi:hypothetical protein